MSIERWSYYTADEHGNSVVYSIVTTRRWWELMQEGFSGLRHQFWNGDRRLRKAAVGKPVKKGEEGNHVRLLQAALQAAAVLDQRTAPNARLAVDGDFGKETFQAVLRFQQFINVMLVGRLVHAGEPARTIAEDGLPGPETLTSLDRFLLATKIGPGELRSLAGKSAKLSPC